MAKTLDTFEMWQRDELWPKYRDIITECVRNNLTQKEICRRLQLNPSTFSELKKNHKEIRDAIEDGKVGLKEDLVNAMLKLALGYDEITDTKLVSNKASAARNGGGADKKAYQQVRHVGPDRQAIIYLLKINFGIEYDPNAEQIKLMIQKAKDGKETWNNGKTLAKDSDKED